MMGAATSLHLPGTDTGGGGGAGTPLVRAGDPADVGLSSGSTTSSGTARTFSAPSGGTGAASLGVAIDQAVGSGASLAGDNTAGWYVTGLSDGDVVKVVGTWTDGASQAVVDSFVVSVAAAAGESFVATLDLDVTAMTATTLAAGDNTVDGRTVYCELAGETISASGLSVTATKDVYIDIADAFANAETPKLVEIKLVNAAWSANGSAHAVRGRLVSTTAGGGNAAPAAQTRYYPMASGAMRHAPQWQPRYPSATGTFQSSGGSYDHAGDSAELTWYSYLACIRGTWFAWISKTQTPPSSLADLMTPSASHWVLGINDYSAIGTGAYWPATVFAGHYCGNSGSLAHLQRIRCWEFK